MSLSKEQIAQLAQLSLLDLSEEETEKFKGDLEEVIQYMDKLTELDLSDEEPMMLMDASKKLWRKDEIKESLSREKAFQNAPQIQHNHFAIPKTVK